MTVKLTTLLQLQNHLKDFKSRLQSAKDKLADAPVQYQKDIQKINRELEALQPENIVDRRDLGYVSTKEGPVTMALIRQEAQKHNLDPEFISFEDDQCGDYEVHYERTYKESALDLLNRRHKLMTERTQKAAELRDSRIKTHTGSIKLLEEQIQETEIQIASFGDTQEALEAAQKTLTPAQLKALGLPVLDTPDPWGVNRG